MYIARFTRMRQSYRAALHGIFHATNDEFCAQLCSAEITKIRHFMEVVTSVDHQERVGNFSGLGVAMVAQKRFFSAFEQHQRVFTTRKQQGRALKRGGDFAQDENGFLFQRVQVRVAEMHIGEVQIRQMLGRRLVR